MRWAGQLVLRHVKPLGHGGHGKVFAATLECGGGISEQVVLKLPHGNTPEDLKKSKRFLHEEGRLVAKLRHPNIIGFRDFNEVVDDNGQRTPCLMLEHGGIPLNELLRAQGGRLEPGLAAFIAVGIMSGLAHAHAHETVHRDIKPSNVVIGSHGEVKLIDFGIAKAADSTATVTGDGFFKGTPLYASPEGLIGKKPDGRADLWSVGILLYEMLVGSYPWPISRADYPSPGVYQGRIWHAVQTEPLPEIPEELVPTSLAEVVKKLTEKAREERYPSAEAAITALERAASSLISPSAAMRELGQQARAASRRQTSSAPRKPDAATLDMKVQEQPPAEEFVSVVVPAPGTGGIAIPSGLFETSLQQHLGEVDPAEVTEQVALPAAPAKGRAALLWGGASVAAVLAVAAGVGVARRSTAAELDASVQRGPSAALAVESPEVERGRAPPASVGNSEEKEDGGMASALGAKFPVEVPATAPIGNDPDVALVEAPVPEPARSVMARDVAKPEVALPAAPTEQPANHATERGVESTTRMRGGALDVVVEPRGAYVSLDGQLPVHAPVKFDDVRPGAHVLRFGLVAGELGIERRVRVRSGQASTVQVKIANPFDEQG